MKRLRDALTLFMLLMAGVPSALTATRLSLPSIPDFRLPSAGVVNTVFPAATGGAAPYTYSLSGQPPGISFSGGSRRASGTLPTVATETTYTVTYSVSDGGGASASVSFRATVAPPPAPPPPPPPSLSLPTIPDFRLPSGGSVDTVFPAATGGRSPYSYSVSGLPPGISFSWSTRRARGTLPIVLVDTRYTITYSVRDRRGATASVTFNAVVAAATAPPPLALPTVPDFRLPSGGVVDTVFPEATGGSGWYFYSVSGLPPGIAFSAGTRAASGTLPTVATDTTYAVTYSVSDSLYATASVTFSVVVTATTAPPPDPPTSDPGTLTLPFTATETGAGRTEYRFRLDSRTEVSVSLTGMNRDIDCSVNGSRCTNRGGTRDDSWSGTLNAGAHTLTVYPYGGGSGNWTLSVSGRATSPPPTGPTSTPSPPTTDGGPIVKTGVNVSGSRTYALRLSARTDISVELTGMTTDFDCTVAGNRCTNHPGTVDDSWSGTLDAGEYEIVVYPPGGGSGDFTLGVRAEAPNTGGSTGTETRVTTLVDASERNVSASRLYGFTLARSAEVDVALTDLTADFNCWVGSSPCTNLAGATADSWSGVLAAGNHGVVVYPYDTGPGDYSLTVTATETLGVVATPLGGGPPQLRVRVCEGDEDGGIFEDTCVEISIPGGGPGQGTPGPDGDDDDGGTPTGGGPTGPTPSGSSLAAATSDINCEGWNIDDGDGFDADRANADGTTRKHGALDIQVSSADASFFALSDGTITSYASSATCGHQIAVRLPSGGRHVYCHMDQSDRLAAGTEVRAGDRIGSYGPSGVTSGPHLHLKVTDSNDRAIDPVEAAGGESAMAAAGFTFNSSDAEHCAGE